MTIYSDLEEARAQLSAHQAKNPEQHTAGAMSQASSDQSFLAAKALDDQAVENSKQATYRASGMLETRGTYHADTLVDIGGTMARLDNAIELGLVPSDTLGRAIGSEIAKVEPKADDKPKADDDTKSDTTLNIDDINSSISPEMNGQLQYVDTVLGSQLSDSLLDAAFNGDLNGNHAAVTKLADASGLSMEDALSSASEAMEARVQPVAQAFQQLVGHNVDFDHALQWMQSSQVSHQERQSITMALKSGNGVMLHALAMKYKAYNSSAVK